MRKRRRCSERESHVDRERDRKAMERKDMSTFTPAKRCSHLNKKNPLDYT